MISDLPSYVTCAPLALNVATPATTTTTTQYTQCNMDVLYVACEISEEEGEGDDYISYALKVGREGNVTEVLLCR